MKITLRSKNISETLKIGEKLGRLLKSGDIVLLYGDLGTGKTVLTKGIAKGMDIDDYITSPTFMLVCEHIGRIPLYHFDVYRIADYTELYDIGYEEYFFGIGVCVIEWPERVEPLIPDERLSIRIERGCEDEERIIKFESFGWHYDEILKEMSK